MTKPLAGRGGARIVGTIGGTTHRPRPINSAVHSATNGTGGSEQRRYTPHNHRRLTGNSPYTPIHPYVPGEPITS